MTQTNKIVNDADSKPISTIQPEHIAEMVQDLFVSMLGMKVETTTSEKVIPINEAIESSILVVGDWNAEIRVRTSQELANQITCIMFGKHSSDVSDDEVADALREVVNVIGGNIKGFVSHDSQLSLPQVEQEKRNIPDNSLVVDHRVDSEPLSVIVTDSQN